MATTIEITTREKVVLQVQGLPAQDLWNLLQGVSSGLIQKAHRESRDHEKKRRLEELGLEISRLLTKHVDTIVNY